MLQSHERTWWWKVAMHLDEAQRSLIAVLAINVDDPTPIHLLQGKFRDAQAFLLEIFRWKGLLPGAVLSGPTASTVAAVDATAAGQSTDATPDVTPVDEIPHANGAPQASQEDVPPSQVDSASILGADSAQGRLGKSVSNLASVDAILLLEGLDR